MIKDMKTHYGPWAVVTGASSGIGKAIAQELASKGINLVLVARSEDPLAALASDLSANHGVKALALPTDLTDRRALSYVLEQTVALDVGLLVAAAGFGTSGSFALSNPENEAAMIDLNIMSVALMTQHYAQRFWVQRRGAIILLGSIVGKQGAPGSANYAATKNYIHALGEALALELRPRQVDVLVCAPGPVATQFAQRAGMTYGFSASPAVVARQALNALGSKSFVAPSLVNQLLQTSLAMTPRPLRVRIMQRIMTSMQKQANQ